jgi:hypothetical protein
MSNFSIYNSLSNLSKTQIRSKAFKERVILEWTSKTTSEDSIYTLTSSELLNFLKKIPIQPVAPQIMFGLK